MTSLEEALAEQQAVVRDMTKMLMQMTEDDRILWAAYGAALIDVKSRQDAIAWSKETTFTGALLERFLNWAPTAEYGKIFDLTGEERKHIRDLVLDTQKRIWISVR